ncbi:methyltransferase domain-containing protein [Maritalea porphyrae]|uniref:Malonyl-[acyl-carrier protein] O-methyltransferase n=1 Tax=Maritalea porphyrae TaxID=880732 RepID=A0ABQ5UTG4_9HYPH|nr:methyltransferase domain-containing protein [Maritalea porphyrae]GLQ18189.1 malonyl-[acyl-carrier protein] O-methyltransferase [Maritalea porphyrae]
MLYKVEKPVIDDNRIAACFRRGLDSYDQSASVQSQVAWQLAELLQQLCGAQTFSRIFEFGCGTGGLTKHLAEKFQFENFVANDLVPECGAQIRDVIREATFVPGAAQHIELPDKLDLVASSSAIQWIPSLDEFVPRLASKLNVGGWLALSGFGSQHFHQLQSLGSRAGAPSYTSETDLSSMLPSYMEIKLVSSAEITLEFDALAPMLRHLRDTGVNGRADGQLTKANFAQFEKDYFDRFAANGIIPLTYQPVWLVAQRIAD